MKKYKMAVSDFDGTLLRSDGTISDRTKKTVSDFIERGGIFTICTGRLLSSIRPEAIALGLKGNVICCQGALVADIETGKTLVKRPICTQKAVGILRILEAKNKYIQIYVEDFDGFFVRRKTERTKEYSGKCHVDARETEIPLSEFVEKTQASLYKILVIDDAEATDELITELKNTVSDEFNVTKSNPYYCEINDVSTSKGLALVACAEYYGVKVEETIAFGDDFNDVSMIKSAGCGAAMGNARDYVKKEADIVVDTNDNDGVAKAIEELCI